MTETVGLRERLEKIRAEAPTRVMMDEWTGVDIAEMIDDVLALLPTEGEPDAWREQAHKAVDHFGELPENWDSYGAEPPSENVRFLAHKVVDAVESIQRVAPFSGGIVVEISPDLAIWCEDDEPDDARAATPQGSAEVERLRSDNDNCTKAYARLQSEIRGIVAGLEDPGPEGMTTEEAVRDLRKLAALNPETDG